MVDASNGFLKDGNKNRLRYQDIRKIIDVFNDRVELPHYSRMVPLTEIANSVNQFNLNIPRYIDSTEPEDIHDLGAHLHGGIPNRDLDSLKDYWNVFPSLRQTLFRSNSQPGYSEALVESSELQTAIQSHDDFAEYGRQLEEVFQAWSTQHRQCLEDVTIGSLPNQLIAPLSETLLVRCSALPLIDPYDIYQRLMEYWSKTMQDDLYLIAANGWIAAAKPREIISEIARKLDELPDLTINRRKYKMDLVPPRLIAVRYFASDQAEVEAAQAKHELASHKIEQFMAQRTGMREFLQLNIEDNRKLTKANVKRWVNSIDGSSVSERICRDLESLLMMMEDEESMARIVMKSQLALNQKVLSRYYSLTIAEVKALVIEDKWFARIGQCIHDEFDKLTQTLAMRLQKLELRYAYPLAQLEEEVGIYGERVAEHLLAMGVRDWHK